MYNQKLRPRRMRITPAMRAMVRETTLSAKDFVYPIFVVPGEHVKEEIPSMPNCYHLSVDNAVELAKEIASMLAPRKRNSQDNIFRILHILLNTPRTVASYHNVELALYNLAY